MNKLNLFFLLVHLITYINTSGDYISPCVNVLDDNPGMSLSENICNELETSNPKYVCVINDAGNNCEEIVSSECSMTFRPESRRRRVESESLRDEDCYNLKTSNKYNYGCLINDNRNRCIEVLIESECTITIFHRGKYTKEDCKSLKTSEEKLKCVPSEDQTYCVQDDSKFINRFNLFILILCLLSLF